MTLLFHALVEGAPLCDYHSEVAVSLDIAGVVYDDSMRRRMKMMGFLLLG